MSGFGVDLDRGKEIPHLLLVRAGKDLVLPLGFTLLCTTATPETSPDHTMKVDIRRIFSNVAIESSVRIP